MIQRETLCLALALMFCATVVAPGILIFWDRSPPFEVVDASIVEKVATPGQIVHFRVTARRVSKTCEGHVDRVFVDSAGKTHVVQSQRSAYQYFPDRADGYRPIERLWQVPIDAAPGEGTYVSYAKFWCYPLQFLVPIEVAPIRARLVVVPKGTEPQQIAPGLMVVPSDGATGVAVPLR